MNVESFVDIVENIFKDIYPEIAKNIINISKKTSGVVLEIGSGTAILSRRLAELGDFKILALDINHDISKYALDFIKKENKKCINVILGNVEILPIKNNAVDLIISRGSLFFWEDKIKAFKEIYRVLRQNGVAYIGGGLGNKELKKKIENAMVEKYPNWQEERDERLKRTNKSMAEDILKMASINTYKIITDESGTGFWIIIYKN